MARSTIDETRSLFEDMHIEPLTDDDDIYFPHKFGFPEDFSFPEEFVSLDDLPRHSHEQIQPHFGENTLSTMQYETYTYDEQTYFMPYHQQHVDFSTREQFLDAFFHDTFYENMSLDDLPLYDHHEQCFYEHDV